MQDEPAPIELLSAVAGFLRDVVATEAAPRTAFQARVAANALDLVGRQISLQRREEDEERVRLASLLGKEGPLEQLNEEFAQALAGGVMTLASPGVPEHLWLTTLAKLAVDQPNYASHRAVRAAGEAAADRET